MIFAVQGVDQKKKQYPSSSRSGLAHPEAPVAPAAVSLQKLVLARYDLAIRLQGCALPCLDAPIQFLLLIESAVV